MAWDRPLAVLQQARARDREGSWCPLTLTRHEVSTQSLTPGLCRWQRPGGCSWLGQHSGGSCSPPWPRSCWLGCQAQRCRGSRRLGGHAPPPENRGSSAGCRTAAWGCRDGAGGAAALCCLRRSRGPVRFGRVGAAGAGILILGGEGGGRQRSQNHNQSLGSPCQLPSQLH